MEKMILPLTGAEIPIERCENCGRVPSVFEHEHYPCHNSAKEYAPPVFEKRTTIERGHIEVDGDGVETIDSEGGCFMLSAFIPPEAWLSSPGPGYIPGDEGPPGRFEIVVRFWPEKVEK